MIEFNPNETGDLTTTPKGVICIVGVGGAGANVLDRIALDQMVDAELINMNSDVRALTNSMAPVKIQLGKTITQGLGSGGDPELGMEAAKASEQEIRQVFQGRQMVFLCAGLGGGTGSGSAPYVARVAREMGAFVVAFVTQPFSFEGKRRLAQAEAALREFRQHANILVVFENDRMGELALASEGIQKAFLAADQIIGQSIRAVTTLVRQPGIIRLGLDDLRTALKNQDARCLFGYGEARGEHRATEALESALKSPLLNQGDLLSKSSNVLVHISGGDSLTLHEIEALMQMVGKSMPEDAQILFGAAVDPSLGDRLTVTVITSIAGKPAPVSPGQGPGSPGGGGGGQPRVPSFASAPVAGGYANPNLVQQSGTRSAREEAAASLDQAPFALNSADSNSSVNSQDNILPFSQASPAPAPAVEAFSRTGAFLTTASPSSQSEALPEVDSDTFLEANRSSPDDEESFLIEPDHEGDEEDNFITSQEDGGPYEEEEEGFIMDKEVVNDELPRVSLQDLVGPPQERKSAPAVAAKAAEAMATSAAATASPAPPSRKDTAPVREISAGSPLSATAAEAASFTPPAAVAAETKPPQVAAVAPTLPTSSRQAPASSPMAAADSSKSTFGRLRDLITAPSSKLPSSLFGDEEGEEDDKNEKDEMNPIARELLTPEQQKQLDVDAQSSGHFKRTNRQYNREGQDLDIPAFLRRKQGK